LIFSFDDGPDAGTTPVVLDLLKARHIHAVFFQNGWRLQRGDVVGVRALDDRIIREGHIIGNHTISHGHLCIGPAELMRPEIEGAEVLLASAAHMPVPWFRAPYGNRCPRVETLLASIGRTHFHWDIDPQEWRGLGAKHTANNVIRRLWGLQGRAVLLMHDTKYATRYALPLILDWIDHENRRRATIKRRPIRFVDANQLAAEQLAPTWKWVERAVDNGEQVARTALSATVP
jgi:peptidoglycan-N-acetylglucosamine deacetylase